MLLKNEKSIGRLTIRYSFSTLYFEYSICGHSQNQLKLFLQYFSVVLLEQQYKLYKTKGKKQKEVMQQLLFCSTVCLIRLSFIFQLFGNEKRISDKMKHHAIKFVCAHIHFIGVNLMSFSDTTSSAFENLIPQTASTSHTYECTEIEMRLKELFQLENVLEFY